MKAKTEVLFTREREFTTDKIVMIETEIGQLPDYFHIEENGGSGGQWQNRSNVVTKVNLSEARRLALEWGEDLEDVAEKLA